MVLETENLRKQFRTGGPKKRISVLKDVSFSCGRGETLGIVGDSGAGKTTLALILCGLLRPDQGNVRISGEPVSLLRKGRSRGIHPPVQMVWQHPETAFNPRWKLGRSLEEPLRIQGIPMEKNLLEEKLARVDLNPQVLDRRPHQLSGGELQRLALARSLLLNPAVVVLDEPTSMLDALTQAGIMDMLQEIQRKTGVAYIFISHDPDLVRIFSHRACRLNEGKLTCLKF